MGLVEYSGIARRIDDLGRITIPKELRQELSISENQEFNIGYDKDFLGGSIILTKFVPIDED